MATKDKSEALSLGQALPRELGRNIDLLMDYSRIASGSIGATLIRADIQEALDAYETADVIAMIRAFEKLKQNGK